VTRFCEHSDEPSGSTVKFLEQVNGRSGVS
jgi:hypothetical protein